MEKHKWEYACSTPQGGSAGGDSVYACRKCGKETMWPERFPDGCPGGSAWCPGCDPHPKHVGRCRFACACTTRSEKDGYGGATPDPYVEGRYGR